MEARSTFVCLTTLALAGLSTPAAAQDRGTSTGASAPGLPPPTAQIPSADVTPQSKKEEKKLIKGFVIASDDGNWSLKVGAVVQVRFVYNRFEDNDPKLGNGDPNDQYAFQIARARLILSGTAITKDLGYQVHLAWDKGGLPSLKDAYLDYRVHDYFRVRAGQFKKPFDREEITSDAKLEFVDRSITDAAFGQGRDIGITIHDNYEKSPTFEYAIGAFNGTGEKTVFVDQKVLNTASPAKTVSVVDAGKLNGDSNIPTRFHPMLVGRVGYNLGKIAGYSEADLEGGPARLGVAAGTKVDFNLDNDSTSGVLFNGDLILKAYGFSATAAGFFAWASTGKFVDQKFAGSGARGQIGYTIAKLVEPAFRYARVQPIGTASAVQEILGAVSFYPYAHDFAVQVDGGALITRKYSTTAGVTTSQDFTNGVVRVQGQIAF